MNIYSKSTGRAEAYVSPSFETTSVRTEAGFCASPDAWHNPFDALDPLSADDESSMYRIL